jgi:hypothetical protein
MGHRGAYKVLSARHMSTQQYLNHPRLTLEDGQLLLRLMMICEALTMNRRRPRTLPQMHGAPDIHMPRLMVAHMRSLE